MSKIMNTSDIDLIISHYFAGEASDSEIATLVQWVKSSEENKRFFFEQRRIWDALSPNFTCDDIDPDLALARLLDKYSMGPKATISSHRRYTRWIRYAVACLLPVSILLVYQNYIEKSDSGLYPVVLNTAYGGRIETTLPDGSRVWLNSNSSLAYDIPFNTDRRCVKLTGEAYFDVSSDKAHPFIVSAGNLEVVATGTQFNVDAYPNRQNTQTVTLVEGQVNVNVPSLSSSISISPDNILLVDNGNFSIIDDNTSKFCSWKDGLLDFRNDSLGRIITRLEQIYPVEFEVEDSTLLNQHYYAVFENETINEIIHLMELSGKLTFTQISLDRDIDTCIPEKLKVVVTRP